MPKNTSQHPKSPKEPAIPKIKTPKKATKQLPFVQQQRNNSMIVTKETVDDYDWNEDTIIINKPFKFEVGDWKTVDMAMVFRLAGEQSAKKGNLSTTSSLKK
jgi:hypothetical protein